MRTVLRRSRLLRAVPAGLLDTASASLATFAVGLFAARYLEPATLGIYAIFRTAMFASGTGPSQMIFIPSTVLALPRPRPQRLQYLLPSLRVGIGPAFASAVLFVGAAVLIAPDGSQVVVPLALTALATAVLSSVQDHVRRVLHLAGVSWRAAVVSLVQLGGVLAAMGGMALAGVSDIWVPFGALGIANALSLSLGIGLALAVRAERVETHFTFRDVWATGRWLLVDGLANPVGNFLSAGLIARLAGPTALGFAEAARIVAQPVMVAGLGLNTVLGPRSMEAATDRDRPRARSMSKAYIFLLLGAAAAYLALAGTSAMPLNPFARLVPTAYLVPWLVVASIAADALYGLYRPQRSELIGGERARELARVEVAANGLRVAAAAAAAWIGSFALPLSLAAVSPVRGLGYRRALRRHYA